jgi:excisionase family DNA binding protein
LSRLSKAKAIYYAEGVKASTEALAAVTKAPRKQAAPGSDEEQANKIVTAGEAESPSGNEAPASQQSRQNTFSLMEAAAVCGVEAAIVRDWIESRKLRAVNLGDSYQIPRSELARTWRELGGGELFAE